MQVDKATRMAKNIDIPKSKYPNGVIEMPNSSIGIESFGSSDIGDI